MVVWTRGFAPLCYHSFSGQHLDRLLGYHEEPPGHLGHHGQGPRHDEQDPYHYVEEHHVLDPGHHGQGLGHHGQNRGHRGQDPVHRGLHVCHADHARLECDSAHISWCVVWRRSWDRGILNPMIFHKALDVKTDNYCPLYIPFQLCYPNSCTLDSVFDVFSRNYLPFFLKYHGDIPPGEKDHSQSPTEHFPPDHFLPEHFLPGHFPPEHFLPEHFLPEHFLPGHYPHPPVLG